MPRRLRAPLGTLGPRRPHPPAVCRPRRAPSIPRPTGRQDRPEGRRAPLRHGAWAPREARQHPSPTPPTHGPNVGIVQPWSQRPGGGLGTVATVGRQRRLEQTGQSGSAGLARGDLVFGGSGESGTQHLPATFGELLLSTPAHNAYISLHPYSVHFNPFRVLFWPFVHQVALNRVS